MTAKLSVTRFAIDTKPRCVWVVDAVEQNREFLQTVDPKYFDYLATVHSEQQEESENRHAAMALRTAYGHAIEVLFAFLCAAIQAPQCAYAWLSQYHNRDLRSMVEKISGNQPIFSNLALESVSWEGISTAIHRGLVLEDKEREARIKAGYAKLWRRFSYELLD